MTDNTPDTQLEEITETGTPNIPDHTATPYTPVFNDTVRTVIYVVTLVASVTPQASSPQDSESHTTRYAWPASSRSE